MTLDPILKEELWRSVVVYFVSFLAIGMLIISNFPIHAALTFPLALIPTGLHCWFMVWYRRKEHIVDPSPVAILSHALKTRKKNPVSCRHYHRSHPCHPPLSHLPRDRPR